MTADRSDDRLEDPDAVERPPAGADGAETPEIDEGRYLYCLVRADDDATFDATGVDDEPVSVVTEDGIGAVVHDCDGLYDSSDLEQIKRWLVRHQVTVDEAGEAFGTPVPFQFDTILRGDDDDVRTWLREEYDLLERTLSELAAHWEYRVEVVETEPIGDDRLLEHDDELRDLDRRIDDAGEGTAFLLEKQYDQRIAELRAARRESLTNDLTDRLDDVAREVHALERSPTASLSDDLATGGGSDATDGTTGDGETLCRLTLLAHEDEEGEIGSILEDVASTDGLEVRFTGPWPPYTFTPALGDDDSTDTRPADPNP
ncbi:gas vesicle protein GvpL [Natrarchaeobius chitinivorans]|uniref:Gas vesicle protein GvpFL n=1 Tax=Natrarchaeobius chitinivorans TaxID=1679083 RepID=A0A3N6MN33_NATCH|nr:GvpL/GvpF family gas vesicle protein [Natrarchaeobius chitinivorans]RQG95926.1 gas vesicle protein GvpFL [Natrarchaeobius chitinivorans]